MYWQFARLPPDRFLPTISFFSFFHALKIFFFFSLHYLHQHSKTVLEKEVLFSGKFQVSFR